MPLSPSDWGRMMTDTLKEDYLTIRDFITSIAPTTLKVPCPPLKYPFVDPGSVYNGNLWDWDSFWAIYGLMTLDKGTLPEGWLVHGKGNVLNFLDHQLEDGYIPMMIETHKNEKIPWLNREHLDGVPHNMHKPFLCQQALLISEADGDFSWISSHIHQLENYFSCYRRLYLHENTDLYVWKDDIMIGMDNDPASFGRTPGTTANIFLNSFMVRELQAMETLCRKTGLEETSDKYKLQAEELIRAVNAESWDPRDRFFYSVDVDVSTRTYDWIHQGLGVFWKSLPIRIQTWSGFLPLWAGFADADQAEAMRRHFNRPESFRAPGGLRTLSREEKMYNLEATNNPSNWLGPVWIVASYCVFRGLLNYGFYQEARDLATDTLKLLAEDIQKTGTLHEYYNPESCEPVMNSGFVNWNILALNMYEELDSAVNR